MKLIISLSFSFLLIATAQAQDHRVRSPLDPTSWGVVYDIPATKQVKLKADVPYLRDAKGALTLDLYLPPKLKAGEQRPAVVFLNVIGDRPDDKLKHWEIYRSWPRLVAAHELVGVSMEADGSRIQECLRAVFNFLQERGAEHGIDGSRVGVYAASANVANTTQYLMSDSAAMGIRAAALYYGRAPEGRLRADLPVLYLVAEGDAPGDGPPQLLALWQRVIAARAPWTLAYASKMPHGFEAFSDNDQARRVIQQTLAFWKSHLEPAPAPSWPPALGREIVATMYANDQQKTAELLVQWIAEHPNDAEAHMHYGRALQQLRRFDEASLAFEKALSLGHTNPSAIHGFLGMVKHSQQRWEEAAQLLERAIEGGFATSLTYGQLASAQLHAGRNEEAVKNYEKAFELGIPPGVNTRGVAWYNLACGYSRLGRKDKAFEALSQAVDEGFKNREAFDSDPDLAPLRTEARFQEIRARLGAQ